MGDQRIAIIGFMGSGKTIVARELASLLHCDWIDLDDRIEKHERRTPGQIIESDGEEEFRRIETQVLRQQLGAGTERVLALGGGAWMIAANRQLLKDHNALTIWLDTPFDVCWKRISETKEERPLARNQQMANKLYDERRPIYRLADLQVVVEETLKAAEIAEQIASIGAVARP